MQIQTAQKFMISEELFISLTKKQDISDYTTEISIKIQ